MNDWKQWDGFEGRLWKEEVNTRDFIQKNYQPYDGDASFLEGPTGATDRLWGILQKLQKEERAKGGVLDMDTDVVSTLTSHGPGYISEETKDLEKVVGLQTDKPLKRAFMPFGGIRMAEEACRTYGYEPSPELHKIFSEYCKTHNQGVFDVYTPEIKKARHNKIITGLPDTYGRGTDRRRLPPGGSLRHRLSDGGESQGFSQLRGWNHDRRCDPSERRDIHAVPGAGRDEEDGPDLRI